ncbi:MAG: LVIVD repeat-containing protein [Candidatus Limnocylindria bacterium]
MRPLLRRLSVGCAILALSAQPALASDPYHGRVDDFWNQRKIPGVAAGGAGPLVADGFTVLGHANLGGGVPNGDVAFFDHGGSVGKFAYVGTWSGQCTGQGAKIVDVNDPTHPMWVGFVGARKDSSNEDVVVIRIGDRDVLGIGVQPCGRRGQAGLALYDVTDPRHPSELAFFATPSGVHELDLAQAGTRTLAALALPFNEFPMVFGEDFGGEVWIADITDPTNPTPVSDWGIIGDSDLLIQGGNDPVSSSFQGLGFFAATYAHSVRFADDGGSIYVSYWDAGFIKLDVSVPESPSVVGRTLYGVTDAGDGHSLTPYDVDGTRYLLTNDEDFAGIPETIKVTSSATGATEYPGIQEPWAATWLYDLGSVSGEVFDAGEGCEPANYAGAAGKVALADTIDPFYPEFFGEPPCSVGTQASLAADVGALAFVSNLISVDDAYPFGPGGDVSGTGGMPILQIADIDELAADIRAAMGGGAVTLTATSEDPPTWGFLRVYQETGADEWGQVGEFRGPATGPFTPPGSWSIHNTEVLADRAYSAWYSAGIIALDLSDPTNPTMVGQFVPNTSKRHANSLGTGPAEVWGVAIDPETGIVYASDMRTGLWIVEPTGDAAPTDD